MGWQSLAQSSCTRAGSARSSAFRCFCLGRLSGLPLHLCDSWHFLEKRLEHLWRRLERGVALDERGLGSGAVLVPLLETATATVEYVITLAARGWPHGRQHDHGLRARHVAIRPCAEQMATRLLLCDDDADAVGRWPT